MTAITARKLIHKRRCQGLECINCEYLAGLCSNPEVKEIVEALRLRPLTYKTVNGERVGYPSDGSGSVAGKALGIKFTSRNTDEGDIGLDESDTE